MKPDVRLYKYAMETVGVQDPSQHIMIGDNINTDIKELWTPDGRHSFFSQDMASPVSMYLMGLYQSTAFSKQFAYSASKIPPRLQLR